MTSGLRYIIIVYFTFEIGFYRYHHSDISLGVLIFPPKNDKSLM
jgi:hypothetical protein